MLCPLETRLPSESGMVRARAMPATTLGSGRAYQANHTMAVGFLPPSALRVHPRPVTLWRRTEAAAYLHRY